MQSTAVNIQMMQRSLWTNSEDTDSYPFYIIAIFSMWIFFLISKGVLCYLNAVKNVYAALCLKQIVLAKKWLCSVYKE